MNVAGNLFIPKNLDRNKKAAAIVVGHPMGAVKEQSANLYATKMAEQGFIALSLDLSCWGGSDGQPRNAVAPDIYAEDFSAAVGAANRNALNHSQTLEQRKQIIAAAAGQRYVEFTGGATQYTSGAVHELTADTHPIQREFYDFYRTPRGEYTPEGGSAQTTAHPTLTSNVKFMNFYPFTDIETISPRPMLFITGDQAHSREFSEDAFKLAAEPKELHIVPGAGHVDLYDRVNMIPWDKLISFFNTHLA